MVRDNPILPSEPLSLQPNLIAAAVIAEELDNHNDAEANGHGQDLAPRNASKVKRRLDNRHYGRSESRGRSEDRDHSAGRRHRDRSRNSDVSPRDDAGRAHYERSHSPRRTVPDDRGRAVGSVHSRGHGDEDRDSKRYRIAGSAAEDSGQTSYYSQRRYVYTLSLHCHVWMQDLVVVLKSLFVLFWLSAGRSSQEEQKVTYWTTQFLAACRVYFLYTCSLAN
ncbi:hypothetical protein GGF42_002712 [Coemansia sp. RSA 2424]|nr:hypothetical protein GGF42_002712 [Coemansia sp. RSA 2424]